MEGVGGENEESQSCCFSGNGVQPSVLEVDQDSQQVNYYSREVDVAHNGDVESAKQA